MCSIQSTRLQYIMKGMLYVLFQTDYIYRIINNSYLYD